MSKRGNTDNANSSGKTSQYSQNKASNKRAFENCEESSNEHDFEELSTAILKIFGSSLNDIFVAKRRFLEQYNEAVFVRVVEQVKDITKSQISGRRHLMNMLRTNLMHFLQQSEADVMKKRETFEKKEASQHPLIYHHDLNEKRAHEMQKLRRILENITEISKAVEEENLRQFSNIRAQLGNEMYSTEVNLRKRVLQEEIELLQKPKD